MSLEKEEARNQAGRGPRPEQSLGLEMKAGEPWYLTSGPAGDEGQVALCLPPRMEPLPVVPCCPVAQSSLTLCDPMDCSLPDSSVRGILQARILEQVAMPSGHAKREGVSMSNIQY